jgi:hypothetical protein
MWDLWRTKWYKDSFLGGIIRVFTVSIIPQMLYYRRYILNTWQRLLTNTFKKRLTKEFAPFPGTSCCVHCLVNRNSLLPLLIWSALADDLVRQTGGRRLLLCLAINCDVNNSTTDRRKWMVWKDLYVPSQASLHTSTLSRLITGL